MPVKNEVRPLELDKSRGFRLYQPYWYVIPLALGTTYIVTRLITSVLCVIIGLLITIVVFGWLGLQTHFEQEDDLALKLRDKFKRFESTASEKWIQELSILNSESCTKESVLLYPDNFVIDDTLNNLINLVIKDFVSSWFCHITDDQSFINELREQIGSIIKELATRFKEVDFSEVFVCRLLPIITDHLNNFVSAHELVKNKKSFVNRSLTNTRDLDNIIATNYNKGKLHPAVKLKALDQDDYMRNWLARSIAKVLPLIVESNEINSPPVFILLRELLTNCVLFPVVNMLTDPDFYNQIVENKLGSVMKDRVNVKKFRNALNKHSADGTSPTITRRLLRKSKHSSPLMKNRLTLKTDPVKFQKFIKDINSCNSAGDLKQYKYYISIQISKALRDASKVAEASEGAQSARIVYQERLREIKVATEKRLLALIEPSASAGEENRVSSTIINLDLSLNDVLREPSQLSFFMEFMDQRRRTPLLQFWLVVSGLRDPLEEFRSQNTDSGSDDDTNLEYSTNTSQADDIRQIFNQFFGNPLMKIDSRCYSDVKSFVESDSNDPLLYQQARKSILRLQKTVFDRMQKTDFVAFKQSDLFLRLMAAAEKQRQKIQDDGKLELDVDEDELNGDPLAGYEEEASGDEGDGKISDNVLKAVEDALNEIANDRFSERGLSSAASSTEGGVYNASDSGTSTPRNSKLISKDLQKDLFGLHDADGSGLFDDHSNGNDVEKDSTRLFDDDDADSILDDNDASTSGVESIPSVANASQELRVAGPSDLNLGDEIEKLGEDVHKLEQQLIIIEPLLKKAELTNNVAELRILTKSKLGLQKELKLKELQRQQFKVQESDNTLFGKSRVKIPSYINGNEEGKDYIMYIIEVQKISVQDPNVITAGWMVARRFSQFYKLNHYLKAKYPEVVDIEFPKRKVVLKFQQGSLITERQHKLELYLQSLITIEKVCDDRVLRSFLSSEVFDIDEALRNENHLMRANRSAMSMATRMYNSVLNQLQLQYPNTQDCSLVDSNTEGLSSLDEGETNEDEYSPHNAESVSFVKPISDFLISLFQLKRSKVLLRGKTLVLVLQQLFGSTIEKIVRLNIEGKIKQTNTISSILLLLQDTLWPGGQFRSSSGSERSLIDKVQTKQRAKTIMEFFIVDSCSKIFGNPNSKLAADTLFHALQNQILNKHLVLTLLQEILESLFPETMDK